MSFEQLFKEVTDSEVTDLQGRKSVIYEVIPADCEQLNNDEFANFINSIKRSLNQLPVPEEKMVSGFQKLFGYNLEDHHFYKFYSIGNKIFLNTTQEDINIPFCRLIKTTAAFHYLIGAEDFFSDVIVGEDFVHFNSTYLRLVNLYEMPRRIRPFDIQSLGDLIVNFKRILPAEAKRKVNTQRKLHHANLYKTMRNLDSEASYQEAEKMVEAMMMGEEQIFEAEAWFIVRAESLEKLNIKTLELKKELQEREVTFLIESVGLSELFPTILYGIEPLFKRAHDVQSTYLVELLPLKKDSLMDYGYQFTTLQGNDVNFHLFNESSLNYNALLTGVPGSGKSMAAQKIVKEEMLRGAKVIVLDLGNSFRKLSLAYGANIFSEKFNPLQFKDPLYLKELIVSVIPEKEMSSKLEGKIYSIVEANAFKVKSFKELVEELEKSIPEISLYFAELWDFFTDKEQKVSDLTYIDTSKFPDKIKAPLIIYLIEYFKSLKGKKIFVFDEVWSFLEKNSSYIVECFRTFRKHEASAIALSQTLSEFCVGPMGKLIIETSHYKFIFSQSPSEDVPGLDMYDLERIKDVKSMKKFYSEFYLKTDSIRKTLRYYPTDLEYVTFTSEQKENNEIYKFIDFFEPFFDYQNSLERFVDFKYHNKGGPVA